MIKRVISAVIGTRHERERRRVQPIVDAVNEHYSRLRSVSDEELRAQTERFRGIVRERTAELEAKIVELKNRKHTATDPAERDRLDAELNGSDGRSGAEKALRVAISETLGQVLIIRARVDRPNEVSLGRLMDLLEIHPEFRATVLQRCAEAVLQGPFNPHLRYIQGVLQAHGGQLSEGTESLKVAADRYAAQSDRASELEARLALQQVAPADEDNRRRVAELYFERGEVRLAMRALAGLARVARGAG